MKKGRPGNLLRVIARRRIARPLAQLIFAETSTLGLRIYTAERRVQARTLDGSGDAPRQGAGEGFGRRLLRAGVRRLPPAGAWNPASPEAHHRGSQLTHT